MRWLYSVFYYWKQEYRRVLCDIEVLVFFVLLPLAYPILYALIYNPEVVTDVPIVVVDNNRTALSRDVVRNLDASPAVDVVGYCANVQEAQEAMMQRACYAVLVIPADVDEKVWRGEQATLVFCVDMSLLLKYKALYMALTDVVLDISTSLRLRSLPIGVSNSIIQVAQQPIPYTSVVLYNSTSGIASFLIPAVLILILQQSFLLGIAMLAAARHEKSCSWYDGHHVIAQLCGRSLCYLSLYILNIVYLLHFVPWLFGYPQMGSIVDILLFALPMVLSSIFMATTLSLWVREREHVYLMFVFTSVIFIFLSGIAWPRYAMPAMWRYLSYIIPSTWGVEGFVQINTMGASLEQVSHSYCCLWRLVLFYAFTAVLAMRYDVYRHKYKMLGKRSK